jgi:signal transduction histidine kinase
MSFNYIKSISVAAPLPASANLEAQLLQAQKENITVMAGNIAHDVNNILHVIVGFGSLSLSEMGEDDPLRANMNHIIAAAARASNLTRNLLDMSRKATIVRQMVDIREVLRKVRTFLAMMVGENIKLAMSCSPQTLQVTADSGQLEQVMINLASNAQHAMPDGGNLSITTESMHMDPEFIGRHGFGKPGNYALISVTDDGIGMELETAQRIFEPFFTTRMARNGTGLGLSIVYRIITEHNGFIAVSSEPGKGSSFRVYLPLIDCEQRPTAQVTPADPERRSDGREPGCA